MPNGKGKLDCIYCIHFDTAGRKWHGAEGRCRFHDADVPKSSSGSRICCHFDPNQTFYDDQPVAEFWPAARQIAWFGIDLEPGVLYEFFYNCPDRATKLKVLRIPDTAKRQWVRPDEASTSQ